MGKKLKTSIILYPGCFYHEIATAVFSLIEYSEFVFVGPTRGLLKTGENLQIDIEVEYPQIDTDSDILLVPGGDCYSVKDNSVLQTKILEASKNQNCLLAGICNGALVLAQSGVLKGKNCTHTAHPNWADPKEFKELLDEAVVVFEGSNYVDEDLVAHGNVLTAKPWAHIDFAVKILKQKDCIDPQKAMNLRNYYLGSPTFS